MGTASTSSDKRGRQDERETPIAKNRRATFDYEIDGTYEGGLVLVGSEVKSLRAGRVDIVDAYAAVENGQVYLKQLNIGAFEQARAFPHEPRRARKVLLHTREIAQIDKALSRQGLTLIPLRLYFKRGHVKVELGLAKGKKSHDKRHDIAKKTADREAKAVVVRALKR